ncbi:hypothetical protein [Mycoplasmoides pirum]|nr:hypothetical protein [Mycoplasmoides pirum]
MEIRFNLLQFHSFKKNKEFNNYVYIKKFDFDNLFYKELVDQLKIIKKYSSLDKLVGAKLKSIHELNNVDINNLQNIIKSEYKQLNENILQMTENVEKDSYKYFQMPLNDRSRLMCLYLNNIAYPLIFDLKHCVHKVKEDKNYHFQNHSKYEKDPWNFEEENTKEIIINKIIADLNNSKNALV